MLYTISNSFYYSFLPVHYMQVLHLHEQGLCHQRNSNSIFESVMAGEGCPKLSAYMSAVYSSHFIVCSNADMYHRAYRLFIYLLQKYCGKIKAYNGTKHILKFFSTWKCGATLKFKLQKSSFQIWQIKRFHVFMEAMANLY